MAYYAPNKTLAERAAAKLTEQRAGKSAEAGPGRTVTRVIVDKYPTPSGRHRETDFNFEWGCVERWTYNDRPDLPEFGGGFINLTPDMWS